MFEDVGKKVKEVRNQKKMTLKDLSEKTGLSTGYLSQFERGLTAIAVDTLANLAKELDTDLGYFIDKPRPKKSIVVRSYQRELQSIENHHLIYYNISNIANKSNFYPKVVEILPTIEGELATDYPHEGEEFVYVLEGVLTLTVNNEPIQLFPGDTAHYPSTIPHNWCNRTNKAVKILTVNTPNFLTSDEEIN